MWFIPKQTLSIACLAMIGFCLATPATARSATFDHNHAVWDQLLREHVHWNLTHTASQVDYAALQGKRAVLNRYLRDLSAVEMQEFDSWDRDQQLAFLINAYNSFTVELILTKYPDIESIKDLGSLFSSPWKKKFFILFGEAQTLDGIEHSLIRGSGRYNEPLIHFAVNCASIGCPALANEAFVAETLDQQLLESTRNFLKDRSRNRFNSKSGALEVSSIFDWYAEDFDKGWRGYDSLEGFFRTHADWAADGPDAVERLRREEVEIDFLDYDWRLNSLR